jgi:hypothetical protein
LASRRHGSHHAPDTPFLPVLRPPASCGWPQGAWCVRVPGNPREFRRPEGAGLIHGESALVTSSVLPRSVLSAVIAQRAPRRDPEGFPAAGRDGGNPRESTQKWSGAGRWICTRYCAREPLTVSGSRTEPAGDHKLERVSDLRFCVAGSGNAVKVSRLRELVDNSPCYLLTPGTQVLSVRRDHELRASGGSVTG